VRHGGRGVWVLEWEFDEVEGKKSEEVELEGGKEGRED